MGTDEASKYGRKAEAFTITDQEGRTYILGLRDILSKSASDVMDVLKEILADLTMLTLGDEAETQLIAHLVATISDRASTQTAFNDLLDFFHSVIAPKLAELSAEGRVAVTPLLQFFCNLHLLVHMANSGKHTIFSCDYEIKCEDFLKK